MSTRHRSPRRLTQLALAGAVTAAVLVPGTAADAAPTATGSQALALARFPAFAAVPDSAALSSPVVLHGTLRNAAGKARGGAPMLLSAWPTHEQYGALPDYSDVVLTPIARTVTRADGSFVLRTALTPVLAGLLNRDGIDVQLDVLDGSAHHVYRSQVAPQRTTGAWARGLLSQATAALTTSRGQANRWDVTLDPQAGSPVDLAGVALPGRFSTAAAAPGRRVAFPGCSNYTKLPSKIVWEVVATAIARNGTTMKATYTNGAWTESGTGFSYDGGITFLQNGALSRTTTLEIGFHSYKAPRGKAVRTEYLADRWHHMATRHCAINPRNDNVEQIATTPGSLLGGADDQPSFDDWHCDPKNTRPGNADYVQTTNARAKTYTSGLGFSPTGKGSFTGTTTSGYNNETTVRFEFGKVRDGYWCGDTGVPGARGQRVQAFRS
ncbi:MAG: hypothetical protein ACT4QG_05700 [Sporichthyaceae bacterium]